MIQDGISESATAKDTVLGELFPSAQVRDWKLRWKLIEGELPRILALHTEPTSADSIQVAQQRLHSFLIHAFHLKDALIDAASGLGISKSDVENAIKADARLALLADLANADKHLTLTNPLKSGILPVIGRVSGVDQAEGGWKLSVPVAHGSRTLDGLGVAEDAVKAWRQQLTLWRLI